MPSQYSINNFSPAFRDALLNKNIVADTITNNALLAYLNGIGYPGEIETLPNAVSPSTDLTVLGDAYLDASILYNQYVGNATDYSQVNIQTNSTITTQQGPYSNNNDLLNGQFIDYTNVSTNSSEIREELTIKNFYVDVPKQEVINLNTQVNLIYQNLNSYLDENNNLNVGGPSTQAADLLAGLFNGQGVGFDVQFPSLSDLNGKTKVGVLPNDDIRATLLGRVLGATGVINDTQIGVIGGQQLLAHIGYNSAFNLQQETLGQINLNPLTLIQGDDLFVQNYQITTPVGGIGKVLNFTANILGVQSPLSLLQTSIFTFGNKLDYLAMGNIERANLMLKNSGNGQVRQLIAHMNNNLNVPKIPNQTTLRQGYSAGFTDGKRAVGEDTDAGVNWRLYAREGKEGTIIDFLNGEANSPVTSGNYDRSKQISDDGWDSDYFKLYNWTTNKPGNVLYLDAWGWEDSKFNKDGNQGNGINQGSPNTLFTGTDGRRDKTLLSKTEKLFNSGKMRTLITGHGIKEESKSQINSAVSRTGSYSSKGSGVMSEEALKGIDNGPENVFCRTWTTYDRYAQVLDLQKHRGLYGQAAYGDPGKETIYRGDVFGSVLDNQGFVKVSPYNKNNVKKYMFSIENLAWNDDLLNLIDCEIGPGDITSGKKGRIMWFPPYDISFSESTSANWEKHNFIGRGEPMYTYNNTERTGNLSWKIIIDHPNYLNVLKDQPDSSVNDDYLASFFAGCVQLEPFMTGNEKAEIDKQRPKPIEKKVEPATVPPQFNVFFPNDVYQLEGIYEKYEDGKCDSVNTLKPKITIEVKGLSGSTVDDIKYTHTFLSSENETLTLVIYSRNSYAFQGLVIYDTKTGEIKTQKEFTDVYGFDINYLYKTMVLKEEVSGQTNFWFIDYSDGGLNIKQYFSLPIGKNTYFYLCNKNKVFIIYEQEKTRIYVYDINKVPFNGYTDGNKLWVNTLIHSGEVTYIRPYGENGLVSTSVDTSVIFWDLDTNQTNKFKNLINTSYPTALYLSTSVLNENKSQIIITNYYTGGSYITHNDVYDYSENGGKKLFSLNGFGESVDVQTQYSLDYSKILAIENNTNVVKAFNATNGQLLYSTEISSNYITPLKDKYFVSLGGELNNNNYDYVYLYSIEDGKLSKKLATNSGEYASYSDYENNPEKTNAFANDEILVTVDAGQKIYIFNANEEGELGPCYIDRKTNPSGYTYGLGSYREQCYEIQTGGKTTWSTVKCSKNAPPGPVGASDGRLQPDRYDFGLNSTGTTKSYKNVMLDGKVYDGFKDPKYKEALTKYLKEKCPYCRIEIVGYASTVGTFGDDRNDRLSKLRAEWVEKYLKDNILDETFKGRTKVVAEGAVEVTEGKNKIVCPESPVYDDANYLKSLNDQYGCKRNRYATVRFVDDPNLRAKEQETKDNAGTIPNIPATVKSRFITECDYFERLEQTSKVVYDRIKEKIKYFQPAFHSTTPEGFNARLTFLQQCMRQGRTHGVLDNNNPNNLAFGRPPVCILRIGDFYNTKIIIDNVTFDFEPLVWDLNPEGVGVQPMICNVNMSFSFIGGSSLNGPISKLQNALSYNYFANTELYTDKSDRAMLGSIYDGTYISSSPSKDGNKPVTNSDATTLTAANLPGGSSSVEQAVNQVEQNNVANGAGEATEAGAASLTTQTQTDNDETLINESLNSGAWNLKIELQGTGSNSTLVGQFWVSDKTPLTKEYDAKVQYWRPSGAIDIATFKLKPDNNGNVNLGEFISDKADWGMGLYESSNKDDYNSAVFKVVIPAFTGKEFINSDKTKYSIAPFDCPTEFAEDAIKRFDLVNYNRWKNIIDNNPCKQCYPNGTNGKKIVINNVECPLNG